jgi:hypothetical protein
MKSGIHYVINISPVRWNPQYIDMNNSVRVMSEKEQELMAIKYASALYRTRTLRNRLLCTFGYHMETTVDFK